MVAMHQGRAMEASAGFTWIETVLYLRGTGNQFSHERSAILHPSLYVLFPSAWASLGLFDSPLRAHRAPCARQGFSTCSQL